VWWSDNPNPPGENRTLNHNGGRFQAGLVGQAVDLPGNHVRIAAVRADRQRTVTVSTEGGVKQAAKPCLVLEIDHDPGKPVWVRADGLGHQGEEHLFYTSAGKYTAVFWGVSDPEARTFQLTVLSLDRFKTAAGSNRSAVFRLSAPDPRDNGPPRLLEILQ
jgi:hypothetical protein